MQAKELTFDQLVAEADRLDHELPIEQAPGWASCEKSVWGRTFWGGLAMQDGGGETPGDSVFTCYEVHGCRRLRPGHEPIWARELAGDEGREMLLMGKKVLDRIRG